MHHYRSALYLLTIPSQRILRNIGAGLEECQTHLCESAREKVACVREVVNESPADIPFFTSREVPQARNKPVPCYGRKNEKDIKGILPFRRFLFSTFARSLDRSTYVRTSRRGYVVHVIHRSYSLTVNETMKEILNAFEIICSPSLSVSLSFAFFLSLPPPSAAFSFLFSSLFLFPFSSWHRKN